MNTKTYNKLVRDKIPNVINAQGNNCTTRTLESKEFVTCLNAKLLEEMQEFLSNNDIEELVDIYEVMLAILDERGVSLETFEELREKKMQARGAFKEKIFLESVTENQRI